MYWGCLEKGSDEIGSAFCTEGQMDSVYSVKTADPISFEPFRDIPCI